MSSVVNVGVGRAKAVVEEFKQFLLKHNFIAMAVGVVVGVAVNDVVKSLVEQLVNPLIGTIGGKPEFGWAYTLRGQVFGVGKFVGAVVNFLIIAGVVFALMKMLLPAAPPAPPTRDCPECLEKVPAAAKRCKFCAQPLPAAGA